MGSSPTAAACSTTRCTCPRTRRPRRRSPCRRPTSRGSTPCSRHATPRSGAANRRRRCRWPHDRDRPPRRRVRDRRVPGVDHGLRRVRAHDARRGPADLRHGRERRRRRVAVGTRRRPLVTVGYRWWTADGEQLPDDRPAHADVGHRRAGRVTAVAGDGRGAATSGPLHAAPRSRPRGRAVVRVTRHASTWSSARFRADHPSRRLRWPSRRSSPATTSPAPGCWRGRSSPTTRTAA